MSNQSNKYYADGTAIFGPNFEQYAVDEDEARAIADRMNRLVRAAEIANRIAKFSVNAAMQLQEHVEQIDNSGEEWKDGGK